MTLPLGWAHEKNNSRKTDVIRNLWKRRNDRKIEPLIEYLQTTFLIGDFFWKNTSQSNWLFYLKVLDMQIFSRLPWWYVLVVNSFPLLWHLCHYWYNEQRMEFALKLAGGWKERKSGLAPFLSHRPPRAFFFVSAQCFPLAHTGLFRGEGLELSILLAVRSTNDWRLTLKKKCITAFLIGNYWHDSEGTSAKAGQGSLFEPTCWARVSLGLTRDNTQQNKPLFNQSYYMQNSASLSQSVIQSVIFIQLYCNNKCTLPQTTINDSIRPSK